MFILLTAHAVSENNKMKLSRKVIDGVPVLVPTSRIKLVEDAIRSKLISFDGNKETFSRIRDVFKYALKTEQKVQPASNEVGVDVQIGYNQQSGWNFVGSISWKKAKEANAYRKQSLPDSPIRTRPPPFLSSNKKQRGKNGSGSVQFGGGYNPGSGWSVQGQGQYKWGGGSVKVGGGWSQGGGWSVGTTVAFRFAKDSEDMTEDNVRELYVTEVSTPDGILYLPSYTEDKFDNLLDQLKEGEAEITKTNTN